MKFFSVWTYQISRSIPFKVYCPIWILVILFIGCFFFEHGEFHVFFHPVFFAIKIVIIGAVSCIRNWIQTFMRIKRDYMGNDQLLPSYNLQTAVCVEYIAVVDIKPYASDMECFVPLLEKFNKSYGHYPKF